MDFSSYDTFRYRSIFFNYILRVQIKRKRAVDSMDPLSVSVSIAGLATTAAHITTTLCDLTMNMKNTPSLVGQLIAEIALINPAMCNLQMFLVGGKRSTRSQESMILVEQLAAILTGCVCTFSELEKEVDGLRDGFEMVTLDRSRWILREDELKILLERLKDHKLSIVLVLDILECKSAEEAERNTQKLSDMVFKLMENQKTISDFMQRIEATPEPSLLTPGSTIAFPGGKLNSEHTTLSKGGKKIQKSMYFTGFALRGLFTRRSFISFLGSKEDSGIYKSAADHGNQSRSLRSTTSQNKMPSTTRLRLVDIANPSFLCLPLLSSEISNSQWYDFGSGNLFLDMGKWRNINSFLPSLGIQSKKKITTGARSGKIISASVESLSLGNELVYYWLNAVTEYNTTLRLCRLYQDFYQLHIGLLNLFPSEVGQTIPWLPCPTLWSLESESCSSFMAPEDCPDQLRQQLDKYIMTVLAISTKVSRSPPVEIFFWMRNEAHDKYKDCMDRQDLAEKPVPKDEIGLRTPGPMASKTAEEDFLELIDVDAAPCQGLGIVFKRRPPKVLDARSSIHSEKGRSACRPPVYLEHLFDTPA